MKLDFCHKKINVAVASQIHKSNNDLKLWILYHCKNLKQIFQMLRIKELDFKNECFDSCTVTLPKIRLITSTEKPSWFNSVNLFTFIFCQFVQPSPSSFDSIVVQYFFTILYINFSSFTWTNLNWLVFLADVIAFSTIVNFSMETERYYYPQGKNEWFTSCVAEPLILKILQIPENMSEKNLDFC